MELKKPGYDARKFFKLRPTNKSLPSKSTLGKKTDATTKNISPEEPKADLTGNTPNPDKQTRRLSRSLYAPRLPFTTLAPMNDSGILLSGKKGVTSHPTKVQYSQ